MKKNRIFALLFSVSIFVFLTFIKNQPIKTFENNFAKIFNQKPNWGTEKYPKTIYELNKLNEYSYKWSLTFFYTFLYILATYLLIFGLFDNKKCMVSMSYIYVLLFFLILFFAVLGLLTHRFDIGFGVVQYLKRLIQNIYLALFFVIYFWKIAPVDSQK